MEIDALKLLPPEPSAAPMATKMLFAEAVVLDSPVGEEPITLERAKLHLRVVNPDEDDYILSLIIAARQMAEGRLNRTLVRRQLTAVFSAGDTKFFLRKPPIVSVDSVSYLDADGVEQLVDVTGYRVEASSELPRMRATYGAAWPGLLPEGGEFTVRYTAGYAAGEIPQPIIQWMLLSIGTMYDHRATIVNGTISQPLADDFVRWLLQPYMVYE